MKYLCFLFFVIVLQSHASDLSEQLFEGFEPTNNEKLLTETNRLSTLSGTASLSGVLYDADSGELIPDNTNMSLSIIGRVDETDSWGYIQSVNVENSVFEFNDLADGQYLISARNKSLSPILMNLRIICLLYGMPIMSELRATIHNLRWKVLSISKMENQNKILIFDWLQLLYW